MIEAVAIGPDQAVFSIARRKGESHVVAHSPAAARSLFQTKETLRALWIAEDGTCHAAGKRYHTNRGGTWTSHATTIGETFAIWGTADEVFLGSDEGELVRGRPDSWQHIGQPLDSVLCIHGASASDVYIGGIGGLSHFDGKQLSPPEPPDDTYAVAGLQAARGELWLCTAAAVFHRSGPSESLRCVARLDDDGELYGFGKGVGGAFVHRGSQLLRVDPDRLSLVHDNEEKALMVKNGEYATCMTSNGRRVVAGGARSVLVEDGLGFAEWPALVTQKAAPKRRKS